MSTAFKVIVVMIVLFYSILSNPYLSRELDRSYMLLDVSHSNTDRLINLIEEYKIKLEDCNSGLHDRI